MLRDSLFLCTDVLHIDFYGFDIATSISYKQFFLLKV